MTRKEKILSGLAAAHLVLAAIGASSLNYDELGVAGEMIETYGDLTGAGSGYGFFTGDISSGLRAEFDIDNDGKMEVARLETAHNREANLRIGNILGVLSRNVEDVKHRQSVAASWAGKMMARYPKAKAVTVRMETLPIPSMEEYAAGKRYDWEPFYIAKFQRGKKKL